MYFNTQNDVVVFWFLIAMACTYIIIFESICDNCYTILIEICYYIMFICCFMFAVILCKSKNFSPQTFCLVL